MVLQGRLCGRVGRRQIYYFIKAWPLGQAVKTPPFHGGNRGSIPLGVTISSYITRCIILCIEIIIFAGVAELADALDLGSSANGVGVRLPSPAPYNED